MSNECSHATGPHDEECDLVVGLNQEIEKLQHQIIGLTAMCDEAFESWYRLEFGSQVKAPPDVKLAYTEGYRKGISLSTNNNKE